MHYALELATFWMLDGKCLVSWIVLCPSSVENSDLIEESTLTDSESDVIELEILNAKLSINLYSYMQACSVYFS